MRTKYIETGYLVAPEKLAHYLINERHCNMDGGLKLSEIEVKEYAKSVSKMWHDDLVRHSFDFGRDEPATKDERMAVGSCIINYTMTPYLRDLIQRKRARGESISLEHIDTDIPDFLREKYAIHFDFDYRFMFKQNGGEEPELLKLKIDLNDIDGSYADRDDHKLDLEIADKFARLSCLHGIGMLDFDVYAYADNRWLNITIRYFARKKKLESVLVERELKHALK